MVEKQLGAVAIHPLLVEIADLVGVRVLREHRRGAHDGEPARARDGDASPTAVLGARGVAGRLEDGQRIM
jgi:hypothetical protein